MDAIVNGDKQQKLSNEELKNYLYTCMKLEAAICEYNRLDAVIVDALYKDYKETHRYFTLKEKIEKGGKYEEIDAYLTEMSRPVKSMVEKPMIDKVGKVTKLKFTPKAHPEMKVSSDTLYYEKKLVTSKNLIQTCIAAICIFVFFAMMLSSLENARWYDGFLGLSVPLLISAVVLCISIVNYCKRRKLIELLKVKDKENFKHQIELIDNENERERECVLETNKKANETLVARLKEINTNNSISNKNVVAAREKLVALQDELFSEKSDMKVNIWNLYNARVIFEKYQNFVAVSSFYEYIASSRCNTLEGPNGAYNLYESEMRQNIIIGQLSTIIENLEQIKENQYCLYSEMSYMSDTLNAARKSLNSIVESVGRIENSTLYIADVNKKIAQIAESAESDIRTVKDVNIAQFLF